MDIKMIRINDNPNSVIMKKNLLRLNSDDIFNFRNIPLINNNKFLIIKHYNNNLLNMLSELKKRRNIIIYEPLDNDWRYSDIKEYIDNCKILKYVDKLILSNKYCIELFKKYTTNIKLYYNYHEYDTRFKIDYNKRELTVNYIGDINKSSLDSDILKKYNINHITSSNNNNLLGNTYYPSIHIDYLLDKNVYYHLHTSTKLSTALHFKSVFICNRIPIYEELLGKDYSYYYNDNLSDLEKVIKNAKHILNNEDIYKKYINSMKQILDKLKPESIYDNYIEIINN